MTHGSDDNRTHNVPSADGSGNHPAPPRDAVHESSTAPHATTEPLPGEGRPAGGSSGPAGSASSALQQRLARRFAWAVDRLPGWTVPALLAPTVALAAAVARFPRLDDAPPGFRIDEAAAALFARSITRDNLPIFFGGGTPDAQEPFFLYVMKWTGALFGWNIYGARAAAALCGVGVAVACALFYRRALGPAWGVLGGLLVATSFWQLMFSRQAIRPIGMPLFAAVGLWWLWEGLAAAPEARALGLPRRWWWLAAAGAVFGLGLYTDIAFRLVVPAALAIVALLLWNRRRGEWRRAIDPRGLAIMVVVMALAALPLTAYVAGHPDDFWRRVARAPNDESGARVLGDPLEAARDYLLTLRAFVWDGYDAPNVNLPGRAILDPLLAFWALAGFALALRHPLRPLHGVALIWLLAFILPSALSSPGHPGRELAATPAVYLFPLLAMERATAVARARRWDRGFSRPVLASGVVAALAALSVAGSAAWSLYDYFRVWAPSDAAYVAFQGDVRDSLAAIDALPADGAPVYYSTWTLEQLVAYLAPGRPLRDIDGRQTLALPADRPGWLVYPTVTAPDANLLRLVASGTPYAMGRSPGGAVSWQAWPLGAAARDALPYAIPTIAFPDGYQLLGFAIAPVIDPVAGAAPQRPVAVTLVWRVPAGAPPRIARARLAPVAQASSASIGPTTEATAPVTPSATTLLGNDAPELIVTRMTLSFPEGAAIADAQVALTPADPGAPPLAPTDPSVPIFDGYAQLNRIEYRAGEP